MSAGEFVLEARQRFLGELFPFPAGEVGPLGETHRRFVTVLDLARAANDTQILSGRSFR